MKSVLEKIDLCDNNPEKSSKTKTNKHKVSGCSLFAHYLFDVIKSKHNYYGGKDCMQNVCNDLKKHATKII